MGKKSKYKAIRRAAEQLPAMTIQRILPEVKTGQELIDNGMIETKEGDVINAGKNYKLFSPHQVPINHNKEMKKMYNRYGQIGVLAYVQLAKQKAEEKKRESIH